MQKLLRRTVTVGKNYALHIVTVYLFALCTLLSLLILSIGFDWQAFVWVAAIIVFWCVAGISVAFYALSQIDNAVQQIKEDMRHVLNVKHRLAEKYGETVRANSVRNRP